MFGYGLLDVGKALGGPAKFDWGDVTVNLEGGQSAWTNAITGSGGLVKQGTGTLSIGGSSAGLDYTGDTRVRGGTLKVLGRVQSSDVYVEAGGALEGAAQLGGDLTNAGVVHIGEATAGSGIDVSGNYVQRAGSQLSMVLGYGHLQVDGTATLEGGNVHVAGVRSGYVTQAREDVLTATGGIGGRFAGITSASTVLWMPRCCTPAIPRGSTSVAWTSPARR